ncbi:MAG: hypothetical protein AAB439_03660 [Patescibacteria group bacterium]|mgnify:CR=1 FL=1
MAAQERVMTKSERKNLLVLFAALLIVVALVTHRFGIAEEDEQTRILNETLEKQPVLPVETRETESTLNVLTFYLNNVNVNL